MFFYINYVYLMSIKSLVIEDWGMVFQLTKKKKPQTNKIKLSIQIPNGQEQSILR